MNNKTNSWLKGIAIFLVILAVITALISLLFFNTINKITNIQTYKQAFIDTQTYQKIPGLIAEIFADDLKSDTCRNDTQGCALIAANPLVAAFVSATPEARKSLADTLFKPEFLQRHIETALDGFFRYSSNQSGQITLLLPLEGIKQLLQGEEAYQAVNDLIRSLPPCTYKEMVDLGLDVPNQIHTRTLKVPYCDVPEFIFVISPVQKVIRAAYDSVIPYFPGQFQYHITIPEGSTGARLAQIILGDKTGNLKDAQNQYLLAMIPVLLLIIASILVIRNLKSFFKWWGIPLLVTGLLGILFAFLMSRSIDSFVLPKYYQATINSLATGIQDLAADIIRDVVSQISHPILIQSGILAGAGLVMLVCSAIIKKRKMD